MALTPDGLVIKRYPEVLEDINTQQQQEISEEFVTTDDTAVGQFNQIIAEQISTILELVEAVNDNFNVDKAEGSNLDDLGVLKNVFRLDESTTQGDVFLTGSDNTIIPVNSIFSDGTNRFITQQTFSITKSAAFATSISVGTLANTTDYTIVVNGTDYTYESDSDATILEILDGLKALIDADLSPDVTATVSSPDIILETNSNESFTLTNSVNLSVDSVTSAAYIFAEQSGPLVVAANTVNEIITPVSGLDSITNEVALITGRNRETDEEYRVRIKNDSSSRGKATVTAIETALRNTPGVSYAVVVENITMEEDVDGRPPKSFEAVVQGGTDLDVAKTIWDTKAAGIETYGSVTEVFEDEDGQSQEVKFSRPEPLYIAVRVTYDFYEEEVFPTNGDVFIANTVLEHINGLGIGVDLIPKRLYGPIYNTADGIENLVVEVQEIAAPGDTPISLDWQDTTIPIPAREFAQTTIADIYVVGP